MTSTFRHSALRIAVVTAVAVLALTGCTAGHGSAPLPDAIVGDDLVALLPDTALIDAYTQHSATWSEISAEVGLVEAEGLYIAEESCSLVGLGVEFTVGTPGGSRARQEGSSTDGFATTRAMQFATAGDAEHVLDLAEAAGKECAEFGIEGAGDRLESYRVVTVRTEGGIRSVVGVYENLSFGGHADIWIQVVNGVLHVQVPAGDDAALTALEADLRAHVVKAAAALASPPVEVASSEPEVAELWTTYEVPSGVARFDLPEGWTTAADGNRVTVFDETGGERLSYIDHLGGIGGPGCEFEDVYPYTILDQELFSTFGEADMFFAYRTIEFPGYVAASIGMTSSFDFGLTETCQTWNIGGNDTLGQWEFGNDWVTSAYGASLQFASMDEARAYLDTADYATLKRILSSLRP